MKPTTKRMVAMLGLIGVAVTAAPTVANAGGATLYELTENMKLVQRGRDHDKRHRFPVVARRIATAAIAGFAEPGTPLCPVPEFQSGDHCFVNVIGSDNISLTTGLGTLQGQFQTVVQGDNPVDGPEAVVLKGQFHGQMDFSPAILFQIPFGTVTGKVTAHGSRKPAAFTGVFRLPFAGNVNDGDRGPGIKMTVTLRQLFCPATPDPNPLAADLYGGVRPRLPRQRRGRDHAPGTLPEHPAERAVSRCAARPLRRAVLEESVPRVVEIAVHDNEVTPDAAQSPYGLARLRFAGPLTAVTAPRFARRCARRFATARRAC